MEAVVLTTTVDGSWVCKFWTQELAKAIAEAEAEAAARVWTAMRGMKSSWRGVCGENQDDKKTQIKKRRGEVR